MSKKIFISKRIIKVNNKNTWEELLHEGIKLLKKDGIVNDGFENLIIDTIYKYGTYMVLGPLFAFPHAVSKALVNEVGLAYIYSEKEIDFLGKPIKAFLFLATPNNTEHIKYMSKIAEILLDKDKYNAIINGNLELTKKFFLELNKLK